MSASLASALKNVPLQRLVLEMTEHDVVEDYESLSDALRPYRERGIHIAIDDAGAGYSSLQHIIKLKPDKIKLDMSLTRGIETDPARQALASAMMMFARLTNAVLVAEGIETVNEQNMLKSLGVTRGQGYLLGKPKIAADLEAEMRGSVPRRKLAC